MVNFIKKIEEIIGPKPKIDNKLSSEQNKKILDEYDAKRNELLVKGIPTIENSLLAKQVN